METSAEKIDVNQNEKTIKAANVNTVQDEQERANNLKKNSVKLLTYIHDSMIGSNINTLIRTVYGEKPHLYCDFTASGKSLTFIEDYLQT